jgi:periplasmic protein CpxP/Spy
MFQSLRTFFQSRPVRMVAAVGAVALLGAGVLGASAMDGMRGMHGGPHGAMHHGAMGGPMGGPGFPMMMSDRLLGDIGASDAQREQIRAILDAARADLHGQRDAGAPLRQQALTLFTQPQVDAAAAEALRRQMLAEHDKASQRMLQAALDASRVLTPEQRQALAQRLGERQQMFERHRREREALTPKG